MGVQSEGKPQSRRPGEGCQRPGGGGGGSLQLIREEEGAGLRQSSRKIVDQSAEECESEECSGVAGGRGSVSEGGGRYLKGELGTLNAT